MHTNREIHHLSSHSAESNSNDESVELARFRAEWKAEVERKRNQLDDGQPAKGKAVERKEEAQQVGKNYLLNKPATRATAGARTSELTERAAPTVATRSHPAIRDGIITSLAASEKHEKSLVFYKEAIQHEQNGDLDSALASYRQAFRLHENVDSAYQREQMLKAKLQSHTGEALGIAPTPSSPELLAADLHTFSVQEPSQSASRQATARLAPIIEAWPRDLIFEPDDEKRTVYFNDLPAEITYLIIRKMNIPTVERFALVCRKARIMTLDPVYWSNLVRKTYKPPQLPDAGDLLAVISKHKSNFRQLFIGHPRVRTDGLYIAICHYTRPGLSENSWVNVNHLVTYHRYLRFYPNGQVLSLLATEELAPQQVIPIMKPTLRMKGFSIGNWYLTGTTLSVVNLMEASGKYIVPEHDNTLLASNLSSLGFNRSPLSPPPDPINVGQASPNPEISNGQASSSANLSRRRVQHSQGYGHGASAPEPAQIRYVFDMSLELRSKPAGRWNRLDLVTYDSVNLETGEVHPVLLKHQRPFWFSKVRSYG